MERQVMLRRPWTCRWGRFGEVAASAEKASCVFWNCAHPALPDGSQLLDSDACTECPRWTASSRLTAEMGRVRTLTRGARTAPIQEIVDASSITTEN